MAFLIPEGIVGAEGLFGSGEALDAKVAEEQCLKWSQQLKNHHH